MRTFDQIIFDELAAQRPVMLEEVGYLNIDSLPAKITGKGSVSAPRKVVKYAPDAYPDARNVINILESEGVDYQQARDLYYGWLAEARTGDTLTVKGAGVLKAGAFAMSPELNGQLNPNAQPAAAVKNKSTAWLWIIVVIAILLSLFFLYRSCSSDTGTQPLPVETIELPAPTIAVPDSAALAAADSLKNAANTQVEGNGMNYPVPGRYYVVAGVFDIPENADNLIRILTPKFPDLTFEKFDYPGIRPGRTMVTIYSSTKYNETLNMRRELAWSYDLHEYWIYPQIYK